MLRVLAVMFILFTLSACFGTAIVLTVPPVESAPESTSDDLADAGDRNASSATFNSATPDLPDRIPGREYESYQGLGIISSSKQGNGEMRTYRIKKPTWDPKAAAPTPGTVRGNPFSDQHQ
ncbi:hypothetical protein NHH03_10285 [Stieleria sp. TO1_6]|uniref:hypothetical protein n=1 Tax=Stieleria tagensis TaxID=2956795 RepID=UPI00209ADB89|nr:hypothetical protein [Stieleria tagensis]MCO8122126.1 hypothetical protein [Stieleria tagensis]